MERALHFLEAEVLAADRNRVQLEARLEATEELLRKTWRALAPSVDLTTYSQDERALLRDVCGYVETP
eukprot:7622578-Prorocentrum_lima.AAC.1